MDNVNNNLSFEEAIQIAKAILNGEMDPNKGCTKLSEVNEKLDWPDDLSIFGLLAHEQYNHEHLGITAENCVPNIIEECKKLVENLQ